MEKPKQPTNLFGIPIMSKRKLEETTGEEPSTKQRKTNKGFSVGPANLPDGTYRRKTQKIKNDLISKAKVKKAYAKVKSHQDDEEEVARYDPYQETQDPTRPVEPMRDQSSEDAEPTNEIHPDRQAMLDAPEDPIVPENQSRSKSKKKERAPRRGKSMGNEESNANLSKLGERGSQQRQRDIDRPVRYQKEFAQAEEKKAQEAARQKAQQQRQRERKAMIKARRPGKDGMPKLGRQSDILLNRVKRLVGKE